MVSGFSSWLGSSGPGWDGECRREGGSLEHGVRKRREPRMQSPAETHQKRRVLNGPSPWTLKSPRTEAAEELRGKAGQQLTP